MLYTAPCVSFSHIIKPNFVRQLLAQNPDSQLENPLPFAASFLFRPINTDILRQNYLLTVFQVIFQQLLLSTHQAWSLYHTPSLLSIPDFDFLYILEIIYKLFIILSIINQNLPYSFCIFNKGNYLILPLFTKFCFFTKNLLTNAVEYDSMVSKRH